MQEKGQTFADLLPEVQEKADYGLRGEVHVEISFCG